MPTIEELANPTLAPVSAGKLKQLWDSIRSTPLPGMPGTTDSMGTLPPSPADQGYGPPASPDGSPAPPLPPPVDVSSLPSTQGLHDLQSRSAALDAKPSLMQRLGRVAPVALATGIGAAFGAGGAAAQGANQFEDQQTDLRKQQRGALSDQIQAAQRSQSMEYNTAERTRELAEAAQTAAGAKRDVAKTGLTGKVEAAQVTGDSRRDVANIQGDTRRNVVGTQGQTARDVAGIKGGWSYKNAVVGANGRIQAAKYSADAAASRQDRSIAAADRHQQNGFDHTDTKPTADEDRRADLSASLDVMADRAEAIIKGRPDLQGKVAGRITNIRGKMGTSDPDIAELMNIKENLGQLALATHTMRNAGHIETAANAILNNFYNTPEAALRGVESAKRSAASMQTYHRPTLAGKVKPGAAADPLGIR